MNGLDPSIHVHLRFDSLGGSQGGLVEKLALLELMFGWFRWGLGNRVSVLSPSFAFGMFTGCLSIGSGVSELGEFVGVGSGGATFKPKCSQEHPDGLT